MPSAISSLWALQCDHAAIMQTCFHNASALLFSVQDEYRNAEGSVITVDFYNASALLPLTDEALIQRVRGHLEKCEP
eukprot:scaffold296043_cov15-Tisochrysis_lutea.AAC.1